MNAVALIPSTPAPHGRPTIRVGIIGTGQFAQACHIPGVKSHPAAEIVAVCGRRLDSTRELAARFDIPQVYTDYRDLCRDPDVDAVSIVTPNLWHREQAVLALEHGKHVLCEKPLGITVSDAEQMLAAARASGRVHMVAFTYRYCYGVQQLRREVQAGTIGEPYLLRVNYDSWEGLNPAWEIGWRENQQLAGGGVLFDRGAHLFDLARFVLGPIDFVSGFSHHIARQQPLAGAPLSIGSVETDDVAAAWFRHARGTHGQWSASRASAPFAPNSFVQVVGPRGALQAAVSRGSVDSLHHSVPPSAAWNELPLPAAAADKTPHALVRMMHSFVDACLRGAPDREVDATFDDGLAVQRALDGVVRSTSAPEWVDLRPGG